MGEILLCLFIINLGTAFGAGIYEARIMLPQWFTKAAGGGYTVNSAAMRESDTGRKFWGFVTTMPLTLLTIANLVLAWQSISPRHDWWLAASFITLVERLSTFSFFIPNAIKLMKADTQPAGSLNNLAGWWVRLNTVRNLLTLVALALALKALTVSSV